LIGSIDDFKFPAAGSRGRLCGARSTIAAVCKNPLDEGKQPTRAPVEDQGGAVAILDIGWMNRNTQQQAERVDKNVPLATVGLLARIEALGIERSAPFCAALALWLSMIAVVGLASRPACSRTAT